VAVTAIAYIDVVVRCLDAGTLYDVAVYRSYAESFLRWLEAALAGMAS
jgi:sarcosine oxidase gamma subunit